jgi:hypothetical protein
MAGLEGRALAAAAVIAIATSVCAARADETATSDPSGVRVPEIAADDEATPRRAFDPRRFPFPLLQDGAFTVGYVGLREGLDSAHVGNVPLPSGSGSLQGYGVRQVIDAALPIGNVAAAYGSIQGNAVVGLPTSGTVVFGTGYGVRVGTLVRVATDDAKDPHTTFSARVFGELTRGYDARLASILLTADLGSDYGVRRATNALGASLHLANAIGSAFSLQSSFEIEFGNMITSPPLDNNTGGVGSEFGGVLVGVDPSSSTYGRTVAFRSYAVAVALAWDGSKVGLPLTPIVEGSIKIVDDALAVDRVVSDPRRLLFGLFYTKPRLQFGAAWSWHILPRRISFSTPEGSVASDVPIYWSADVLLRYVLG